MKHIFSKAIISKIDEDIVISKDEGHRDVTQDGSDELEIITKNDPIKPPIVF